MTTTTTEGTTGSAMEVVAGTTEDIEDEGRDTSEKDTGTNDKEVMTVNEAEVSKGKEDKGKGKEIIEGSDKDACEEGQPKVMKKITKEKMKGKKASPEPIQELVNCIDSHVAHATLGYALMMVMDNNDLGRGPKMECQQVNLCDIDAKFMASFIKGANEHGLRNWCMENVVDVGIKQEVVDLGSLMAAQSLTTSRFTNHVKWLEGAVNTKAILYNGNHHITYMQEHLSYVNMFNQCKLAEMRLVTSISHALRALHQDAFNKADQIIKEGGVWLLPSAEAQHKYINTTLSTVRSVSNSNLGKILQDMDMFNALFELFKYQHFCSHENAKSGLSMHCMPKWYPSHAGCMLHIIRQAIIMLDFLAAPVDFQDVSKDVLPGGDILAAFEAEYWCLSSKFDKPIPSEACQVLDDKFFIDWTNQHLFHFHKDDGTNVMEYFASM
ncbi:hypothetical protein EV401DRAFT_1894366 [Pisolithus croceorrhizus]|nr:hypothetical protein EV401DRAFT_1894366 [Pisolithus croceorrhizus]